MKAYRVRTTFAGQFRRRSGSDSGKKTKKDGGHVIATVFWYFRLRCRVGVLARVGLEALIGPKTIGFDERTASVFIAAKWAQISVRSDRAAYRAARRGGQVSWSQQVPDIPSLGCVDCTPLKRRQLEALVDRLPRSVRSLVCDHLEGFASRRKVHAPPHSAPPVL